LIEDLVSEMTENREGSPRDPGGGDQYQRGVKSKWSSTFFYELPIPGAHVGSLKGDPRITLYRHTQVAGLRKGRPDKDMQGHSNWMPV